MGGVSKVLKLTQYRHGQQHRQIQGVKYTGSGQDFLSQFCPINPTETGARLQA
jgi:hypothetical protein